MDEPVPDDAPATPGQAGRTPGGTPTATRDAAAAGAPAGTGDLTRRRWWDEASALGVPSALLHCPDGTSTGLDLTTAHPSGLAQLLAGSPTALSSLVREAGAHATARERARAVHRTAQVLLTQHGTRGLALAVGVVSWRGDGAPSRRVPLLLRRCTLEVPADAPDDHVVRLDDEVLVNPVLASTARRELGLPLDTAAVLRAVGRHRGFDPDPALAEVRRQLHAAPGLRVERRLLLAAFADPSADLLADLRRRGARVRGHRVVQALAERRAPAPGPGPWAGTATPDGGGASPARSPLPLDPAQRRAVEHVTAGGDLRLVAPAGTGATQVAAALVAAAAEHGRTVLLVAGAAAERRAVDDRLRGAGLGSLVLHLDGELSAAPVAAAAQRQVRAALAEHERRRDGRAAPQEQHRGPEQDVKRLAAVLAATADALHTPRAPWGVSAHQAREALAELAARPTAPSTTRRLRGEHLAACRREDLPGWAARLEEAVRLGAFDVTPDTSCWAGADLTSDEAADATRRRLRRVVEEELPRARARTATLADAAGLRGAASVAEAVEQLQLLEGVRLTVGRFGADVFARSLGDVAAATATADWRRSHGVRTGPLARWRLRRQARAMLREGVVADSTEHLHDWLQQARAQRLAWQRFTTRDAAPHVPDGLAEAQVAVVALRDDLDALAEVLPERLRAEGSLVELPLPELGAQLAALQRDVDALDTLPRRTTLLRELGAAGWQPLVEDLAARWAGPGSLDLAAEVEAAWWSGVLDVVSLDDPLVGAGDSDALRQARADLQLAVAAAHVHAARGVRAAVDARLDRAAAAGAGAAGAGAAGAGAAGAAAPAAAVADVLPCWALSPAGAAAVLGAGAVPGAGDQEPAADLVLVLGAEAVATAAVLPALSRGAQVVVVGDPALPGPPAPPPTGGPAPRPAASAAADPSSPRDLLAESEGVLPALRLTRQHACLEESLLAGPAADAGAEALPAAWTGARRVERTSGRPAGARRGPEAVVDLTVDVVLEALRTRPRESLGVVLADTVTADAVTAALRLRAGDAGVRLPAALLVAEAALWPGERRDHVVVVAAAAGSATGSGSPVGVWTGPAGRAQVRLALTRSRRRTTLVVDDTASEGQRAVPAELLRLALDWEAAGELRPSTGDPGALVARLAAACADAGLPVTTGVGTGAALPLVVQAPGGGPAVAVDLDAADEPDVLEREVARPARWERAGWHCLRSTSGDVHADPAGEARRIAGAWRSLGGAPTTGGPLTPRTIDLRAGDLHAADPRGVDPQPADAGPRPPTPRTPGPVLDEQVRSRAVAPAGAGRGGRGTR
ncbi:hypothetical protein [Kineococcus sp. SYSU DK004]|uniref:hypothetical protein n=1 Tax=Kineococcus sp. SYSU DK004 TaxID=3383125 RepID=UPI003D7EC8D4